MDRLDTYANYYHTQFRTFIGQNGDSYDRYLLRMNEMSESINIINQSIFKLISKKTGAIYIKPLKLLESFNLSNKNEALLKHEYATMERLVKHFKY
jgi:NADH-quinone oxidoreductase subunit D